MNIPFWVCFQISDKAVSTLNGMVQVVVKTRVSHEQSQCTFWALYLVHQLVHAADGCVNTV